MTEEKAESQQKNRSEDIDYAYAVIDVVAESMDKVAAQPELAHQFVGELLQKMPNLIDALMTLTYPEHRKMMAKLISSSSRMCGAWLKTSPR